jgi:hypothetical protein
LKISIFDPFPFMGGILKRFASRDQARCALSGSASFLLASSRMLPDYKRTKDPEGVYRNDARTPRRLATCQPEQNARDPPELLRH